MGADPGCALTNWLAKTTTGPLELGTKTLPTVTATYPKPCVAESTLAVNAVTSFPVTPSGTPPTETRKALEFDV